jgi:hypothetical protein
MAYRVCHHTIQIIPIQDPMFYYLQVTRTAHLNFLSLHFLKLQARKTRKQEIYRFCNKICGHPQLLMIQLSIHCCEKLLKIQIIVSQRAALTQYNIQTPYIMHKLLILKAPFLCHLLPLSSTLEPSIYDGFPAFSSFSLQATRSLYNF